MPDPKRMPNHHDDETRTLCKGSREDGWAQILGEKLHCNYCGWTTEVPEKPAYWDEKRWVSTLVGILRPILRTSTLTRSEDGESFMIDTADGRSFLVTIEEK